MTKLKTLKDIEFIQIPVGMDNCPSIVCGEYGLAIRKEAIKWVKEIYQSEYDVGNFIKGSKNNASHFNPRKQGKVSWIKHFFNITESDLEDNK